MNEARRSQLQAWMVRLADGDRSAFEPLFQALSPILEGFARRMLGEEEEARDAAQEALLRVFSRASLFDPERDALSWILGIVAYECRSVRKRRRRRREESADEVGLEHRPSPASDPEDEAIRRDLVAAAEDVIGALRPSDVKTLRSTWFGVDRPPVAGPTFRKRLQRAVIRLRSAWRMKYGAL